MARNKTVTYKGTCTVRDDQETKDWFYPALGLAVTALAAIHAWFDFSLQMPAVAVTYAAILGVACAQSYSSRPVGGR